MPPTGPTLTLQLQPEQKASFVGLPLKLKVVAGLLLTLAGLNVVMGVVTIFNGSAGGLLDILVGLVLGFSGLVMLAASTSAAFAVEAPQYDRIHTFDVLKDLAVFFKIQFCLGLLLALIVAISALL